MTGNCYPFLWRGSQVWIGPVFLPLQLLIHWVPWSFGMKVVVVIAMGIQAQWLPSGTQMRPEKVAIELILDLTGFKWENHREIGEPPWPSGDVQQPFGDAIMGIYHLVQISIDSTCIDWFYIRLPIKKKNKHTINGDFPQLRVFSPIGESSKQGICQGKIRQCQDRLIAGDPLTACLVQKNKMDTSLWLMIVYLWLIYGYYSWLLYG